MAAVKQDPNSERAWGWLSNVIDNDKDRIYCLKQVLRINPKNEKANQLFRNLNAKQSQLENHQPQVPIQISQQAPAPIQSSQVQHVKKGQSSNTKSSRTGLILNGGLAAVILCVCAGFSIIQVFNDSTSDDKPSDYILAPQDVFQVSAVDLVISEGYTVTSAVCEVVSSERFRPTINGVTVDVGPIVFHAFRITGPSLNSEVVVLFSSNQKAADGSGLVQTVNGEAIRLFPDFPEGSKLRYPINLDTDGAQIALKCAQQAGAPPTIQLGDIDSEEWRRRAIEKFGQEEVYDDGSKEDYIRIALIVCELYQKDGESMIINMGADYNDSFEKFAIETFCPYVK